MSTKFYEMQAEVRAAHSSVPPAPERTYWLVFAVDVMFPEFWSIRGLRGAEAMLWVTKKAAEDFAATLNGRWIHRTIVEVKLPATANVEGGGT